jgi:NADH dehydrogenase
MKQIAEFVLATVERRRLLVPLPWSVGTAVGTVLGVLPKPPLTADQVELLKTDQVVSEAAKTAHATLEGLGILPQAIEGIVPSYLYRYRRFGQFSSVRKTAGGP